MSSEHPTISPPLWLLVMTQAVVSAASLVVEILAGRMLAPHVGMTLYTWTSVIAVVLAGFSLGHWWGGRIAARPAAIGLRQTGWLLLAAALATAVAAWLLHLSAGPVLAQIGHPVWSIVILTSVVFFLPSLLAGVPAPVLTKVAIDNRPDQGQALGAMFAAGAVGAIAGTLLAGFVFISWLGSVMTLAVVTAVYALTALVCLRLSGMVRGSATAIVAAIGALLTGVTLTSPRQCDVESRYFCIRTVDVAANPEQPVRLMVIDHLAHGISARNQPRVMFTDHAAMLHELALLRAPSPKPGSFFIGGGSYSVPRALKDAGLTDITVAEIDPTVTEIAVRDFWVDTDGMTILHEDARVALNKRPDRRYDLIIGDAFTDVAIPAHLVTREFMELARSRLTPDGSFLMNVIDYEDRLHALSSILRTAQEVFPEVELWTRAERPDPGARVVFVLAAGTRRTPVDSFVTPAPETTRFAALADRMIAALAQSRGQVLTDDLAPIDRLIGPTN